jgi:hypothetical protein
MIGARVVRAEIAYLLRFASRASFCAFRLALTLRCPAFCAVLLFFVMNIRSSSVFLFDAETRDERIGRLIRGALILLG